MSTKRNLREALLFCFHLKKNVAESQRILSEAYGDYTPFQHISTGFDAIKKVILIWKTRNVQVSQKNLKMKK